MAIYYVSTTDGNDSYDGLYPTYVSGTNGPWLTIAKVNSFYASYAPGDSVLFNRGNSWVTGTGNGLRIRKSGSAAGGYITFGAYGSGALPIISHSDDVDSLPVAYLFVDDIDYIKIEYLNLQNVSTAGSSCFAGRASCDHIIVQYCSCTSVNIGLSSAYIDTFEFAYNTIAASGVGIYIGGSTGTLTTNGWVHHNTINGGTDCISIHDDGAGNDPGNNHVIEYNDLGLTTQPSENCVDMAFQTGPVVLPTGVIIRGNNCKGGPAGVLGLNGDGTIVEKNFVYYGGNSGWEGLYVGGGSVNMVVRYNIFTNNGGASSYGVAVGTASAINGLNFYNNVVYNGASGARSTFFFSDVANTNITIKNNIFINEVSGYYCIHYAGAGRTPTSTNTTLDYNCYYSSAGSGSNQFYANGTAYTFATWKSTYGQDAASLFSNPLFVNAGGSYALDTDFTLQAGSPCIKAGTNVGLDEDYGGTWVFGPIDIGAYAYTGEKIRMIVAK